MGIIMKDIKKTAFMEEAAVKKGHNLFIELCIAVLLFIISSIVMGLVQVPVMLAYLLSNKDYMAMIMSGRPDTQKLLSVMTDIPEWVMVVILMAEILLTVTVILYCRLFEKRKAYTLGFVKKGIIPQYLLGLVLGAAAFSVVYLLCVITGSVKCSGFSDNIAVGYIIGYFVGYLIQGMAEEVLCRGYLMISLSRRYPVSIAVVVSSLFFAILHGNNQGLSPLAFINLFLFGAFAALLLLDCGNIWIVGAFHSIWNFVQGNFYGVQVSGTGISSSILETTYTDGYGFINGGSFGMEGGLPVTLVYIAAIIIVYLHLKKKGKIIDISEQFKVGKTENEYGNINSNSINFGSTNSDNMNYNSTNPVKTENMYSSEPVNTVKSESLKEDISGGSTGEKEITGQTVFDESYFKD